MMEKEDVWGTNHWFRNEVESIITTQNLICKTMQELEQTVTSKVKELIIKERPRSSFVDGPWREFVKQL